MLSSWLTPVIVAALLLLTSAPAAAQEKIRLAQNLSPISGITIVAKHRNIFEKHGLDVTVSNFTSGRQALETVLEPREIDFAPFLEAGAMLFNSPLIAERYAEYGAFVNEHPQQVHSVVREIISRAAEYRAADAYRALYRLKALQRITREILADLDVLFVPTAGTIYRCDQVEADPFTLNANMGYYTYFANPLDLCALAVPAGLRADGLPFGVSFLAAAGQDATCYGIGRRFHLASSATLGATGSQLSEIPSRSLAAA